MKFFSLHLRFIFKVVTYFSLQTDSIRKSFFRYLMNKRRERSALPADKPFRNRPRKRNSQEIRLHKSRRNNGERNKLHPEKSSHRRSYQKIRKRKHLRKIIRKQTKTTAESFPPSGGFYSYQYFHFSEQSCISTMCL